jgi:hypothetical protein
VPAAAAPDTGTGTGSGAPATASAATSSADGETVGVPVTCPAGGADCTGTLELRAPAGGAPATARAAAAQTVLLGSGAYTIPAGQTRRVVVTLTPEGRRMLAESGKLKATPVMVTKDKAGRRVEQALAPIALANHPRPAARKVEARTVMAVSGGRTRFVTTGRVIPTRGLTRAAGCAGGRVAVVLRSGTKVLARRTVELTRTCTYRAVMPVKGAPAGDVRVAVRFLGTSAMRPRSARPSTLATPAAVR